MKKTISKGRFVSACECATKLYYKCHTRDYLDAGSDDEFMKALAQGGFQVGELAKLDYPGAMDHTPYSPDESWKLLQQQIAAAKAGEKLVFFEPTIQSGALLARADILEYKDGHFTLHEVKSTSADPDESLMTTLKKQGEDLPGIYSDWEPYVMDVCFQAHVLERAFPQKTVYAELLVVNKGAVASVDGINQCFKLIVDPSTGRTHCEIRQGVTRAALGDSLLIGIDVSEAREYVHKHQKFAGKSFHDFIAYLEDLVARDVKAEPVLTSACKKCEFRVAASDLAAYPGKKSGFAECWLKKSNLSQEQLETEELTLDVWNFGGAKKDALLSEGTFLMRDVSAEDVMAQAGSEFEGDEEESPTGRKLSHSDRRILQISRVKERSAKPYLERDGLRAEIKQLKWPLNLIDFETARVAIPFNAGQRPYGQLVFQFSHHLMFEDGRIEHQNQFMEASPGIFPNFVFVRELRAALGDSGGSVLMYHHHEQSVLNETYDQLSISTEPDRQGLMEWIRTIAVPRGGSKSKVAPPPRALVDLLKWVKEWWYHPATRGSNSIKDVLPVVFADGGRFENIYSKPVYGAKGGLASLNFKDRAWIVRDPVTGKVADPYKTLPPIFSANDPLSSLSHPDRLFLFEDIKNGGVAMQAYARMQFSEMTDPERAAMKDALLRYCELDTFAMGILIEYFRERVGM